MIDSNPVDKLMDDLTKPLFVLRFARGFLNTGHGTPGQRKSAETRIRNARIDIDNIVKNYASTVLRMNDDR